MAMAHFNTDDMKLILGVSTKIRLNYFGLIDAPDYLIPATTTHCLHTAPTSLTTATAAPPSLPLPTTISLSLSGAIRVFTCQMVDIRASVWFTKPVLEEQEKKKKEKKKKKKKKK
ncbi:hypothetical protein CPC735_024530 [Coccidioides posadasii C735 delta SOWgp]|uniref:Uncharacterized protein n=1 Tax=Coccidioides posadasii (strain C735) TaxID=222929 RepID=C5P6R7_COCP7|nr:hypothetical protein CPC735_024530 [Coccidioides posadasii C735 delta SOWgp]EER27117.1 hypothetical protein CPC735_024530 [Coccidioides posadasii C735 delta SOWgp]|eukprot:XP_003069262.1 hypothetical protein CPC735_024530 [Coccidioides posadasii C735 delta SOWgp]